MEIAEFLLARIAEDEAGARAAAARNGASWTTEELSGGTRIAGSTEFGNPRAYRGDGELWDDEGAMGMFEETAAHVVRWDPAHVLAECVAKRRLVTECADEENATFSARMSESVLESLALPYADHPDYDPEWAATAAAS